MNSSSGSTPRLPPALKRIVLDQETITKRVTELARQISEDYTPENLQLVGVLEGARTFTLELGRHVPRAAPPDFIETTQYGGLAKSREIRIARDLSRDITSRHVLLIQTIVDTGLTVNYLMQVLAFRKPASLAVCTLLDRPDLRLAEVPIRYVGFRISDEFLVGYGLHYRKRYGDLPYVATLELDKAPVAAG